MENLLLATVNVYPCNVIGYTFKGSNSACLQPFFNWASLLDAKKLLP